MEVSTSTTNSSASSSMILQQTGGTGTHDETTLLEYNLQNQTEEVSSSEDSTTLTPTDYSSSRKEEDEDGDCDDSDSSDDDDDDNNSSIDSDDNDDDDSSDEFESGDEEFEPGYSVKESPDNCIDIDLEDGRCSDGEVVTLTKSSYVDPFAAPSTVTTTTVEGDEAAVVVDEVATEPKMVFLESKLHHQHEGKAGGTKNRSTRRDIIMWPIPEASELRYMNDEDLDRIIAITSAERRRRRKSRTNKRKKKKPLTFRRAIRKLKRGFRKNWTHRNTASAVMGVLTMGLGSFILWIFINMIGK